jgi:hypothetical protein
MIIQTEAAKQGDKAPPTNMTIEDQTGPYAPATAIAGPWQTPEIAPHVHAPPVASIIFRQVCHRRHHDAR